MIGPPLPVISCRSVVAENSHNPMPPFCANMHRMQAGHGLKSGTAGNVISLWNTIGYNAEKIITNSERQMSRALRALVLVVLVVSCGRGEYSAPRNLDNACSILSQRPDYIKAFRATERRWGVPVHVQMATIYQESKYIGNARTPFRYTLGLITLGSQSSAYGYSHALDGTWDEYRRESGKRGAKRDRIRDASDFMGWYMTKSREKNGIALTDTRNQYLAYHEGHTGYARGSYNRKSWLLRVAGEVDARADMYQAQLNTCPRRAKG